MLRFAGLLFAIANLPSAPSFADDAKAAPPLKPLQSQLTKLLAKHYPKANIEVELKDRTISFSHNTRKFMVHAALLDGEFQDAHVVSGPKLGGIIGSIEWRDGVYGGQAAVPQAFDVRYFTTYLLAPYFKKLDGHLYIHLTYPSNVSKEFLKEFEELVNGFEKHLAPPKK